jgi:hydroxyethylthiazole kinase-like uncharacterized protein yjeF
VDEAPRSARDMAVMEANALALGVSIDSLMENAGRAVAEEAMRRLPSPPARVALVAGTGNNGGDGFGAAFYLAQWGFQPDVWCVRPPAEIRSAPARRRFERVAHRGPVRVGPPTPDDLRGAALAVDALLGIGQSGPLRPPHREAAEALNAAGVPVLSVDVPSGLGAAGAVRPRWTVTLTCSKIGMTRENSGEVVVRDIGIPEAAKRETGPGEFLLFPTPDRARGRSGRVIVIGGGPFAGAPQLSALAALRSGAERATVIAPEPAAGRIQAGSPDLVVVPVGDGRLRSEDVPAVRDALGRHRHSAVIGGMGAGRDDDTVAAFREIFAGIPSETPVLADADALEALVRSKESNASPRTVRPKERAVATPNEGEYQRLFGRSSAKDLADRLDEVQRHAREAGVTIVAKGEADLLSDGERAFANRHQNSAATVGGVGDVLTGVIGSLLAQGLGALDAARLGTHWVAAAGNRAFDAKSYGLVATDVIGELPAVLRDRLNRLRGGAS